MRDGSQRPSRPAGRWPELGRLARESWAISWPMTLIVFLDFLIMLADVWVAGLLGKEVQAAYGVVLQVFMVLTIVGNALTIGTVAVVSRLQTAAQTRPGARPAATSPGALPEPAPDAALLGRTPAGPRPPALDGTDLGTAVWSSLAVVVGAGVLLAAVGLLLATPIAAALDLPPELRPLAGSLLRWFALVLPGYYLLVATNGVLRATGRVQRSLRTMLVVTILHVALAYGLARHSPLQELGIPLAALLAAAVGAGLNWLALRPSLPAAPHVSRAALARVAAIGWPAGALQVFWQLGSLAVIALLSRLPAQRVEILAAFAIGLRIEAGVYMPAFAFNMASAVLTGNALGAGQGEQAFRRGLVTAALGTAVATLLTALVWLGSPWLAGALSDKPAVVAESLVYLRVALLSQPVLAWGLVMAGALNGAGDTRGVALIVGGSVWLLRLPLAWLLGIHLGLGHVAIWWVMNLCVLNRGVLLTWRYLRRGWLRAPLT